VEVRPVKVGALFGGLRAIVSGISAEDRIVTNGQMQARPGTTVAPSEVPIAVDEEAFSDPGPAIARRNAALETNGPQSAVGRIAMPGPATVPSHDRAAGAR
jgi:hypothetical protein